MSKSSDIKKQLKKEDNEFYGEESISGSSPDPESDDSIDEVISEVSETPSQEKGILDK